MSVSCTISDTLSLIFPNLKRSGDPNRAYLMDTCRHLLLLYMAYLAVYKI